MRHFFTLLFTFLMVNFTIGQNYLDNPRISKKENPSLKGTDDISAEMTCESFYAPDATFNLDFTITVISPDWEYGDSLSLTFPAGITPNDGSASIGTEEFNGVNGQTISWGDNANSYGGIGTDNLYEFWVEVTVDAGVSGVQVIDFFLSGDEYGSAPHEFEGTVSAYEIPSTPDLAPEALGYVAEYYGVPITQAIFTPEGRVNNYGAELTEATDFNLTVGASYDESLPITIPLGPNATEDFTFPEISYTETGTASFTYNANASNDANPDNGIVIKNIEITDSILSRHNGDINGATGYGIPGGVSANVFQITTEDLLTAVSFYVSYCQTDDNTVSARIYEFDSVPGDLIAQTNEVTMTEQYSTYTVAFPAQVSLTPGKYLIGIVDGNQFLAIATTTTPYVEKSCWSYDPDPPAWHYNDGTNYADTYVMEAIFGTYQAPDFDVALEELTMPDYVLAGDVDITGTIKNMGGEVLTSIDIEYSINGGEIVLETLSGLSVASLDTYDFVLSTPAYLSGSEPFIIDVHIDNGNGLGPDANPNNNDLSTTISVVEYIPSKMIVGEEGTGTWCGWCVRGHVFMDSMAMKYPDTWIGIAVHNSDPMTVPVYNAGIVPVIGGFPNVFMNRTFLADPYDLEAAYYQEMEVVSPVSVSLENKSYNENTGELSFTLTSYFVATVSDFRFNAVLVENEVSGTGAGWAQSNSYSGGGSGPMGGYENLPDPVPAEDMVYQNVARAILGGFEGVEGSLPTTVNAGETHSYEFTTTIPEDWDINHMEIVGMVINQANGKIENATIESLGEQEINLPYGYSFASSRIIPENPDMMIVLNDILNDNLDFVRNSNGNTLRKIGPVWVNGIGNWITTEGYLFKMNAADQLSFEGSAIDPTTVINLHEGFQFVSYLPVLPIDATVAFDNILNDNLIYIRDSQGGMLRKIGPNWVNGIGDCNPGQGYLIKMFADDELVYNIPSEATKSSVQKKAIKHFTFEGGNAADPVCTIYISGLNIGDEVAAYDGNVMVGSTVIVSENTLENALPIFSTLTSQKGYVNGNNILLRVWDDQLQSQVPSSYTFVNEYEEAYLESNYPSEDGEFSVINVTKGASDNLDVETNVSIYPNPASDVLNVVANTKIDRVRIINFIGQIMFDNNVNNSSININTSAYQSGVYIISVETSNRVITEKITIK